MRAALPICNGAVEGEPMRVLATAAFAAVLFASDQAGAACTKGMLWPYVRNPGDCLTDAETAVTGE